MLKVNDVAMHILFKGILQNMQEAGSGHILNVASSAGLLPGGPYMAGYYASKAYVVSLTRAVAVELKEMGSNVNVSALCPGPVDTNFNDVAGVKFSVKPLTSEEVAKYAIDQMFKKKVVIIPGFKMKLALFGRRFVSRSFLRKLTYNIQKSKNK